MKQELTSKAMKLSNIELRQHNSLLRKNLKRVITCSTDNENAQERMDEMENIVFLAPDVRVMVDTLIIDGKRIFEIDHVSILLNNDLKLLCPEACSENVHGVHSGASDILFTSGVKLASYFPYGDEPSLRGNRELATEAFFPDKFKTIRSEALVPLSHKGKMHGAMGYGSAHPTRFLEGYGSRFLKRLSRIIALKLELFRAGATIQSDVWNEGQGKMSGSSG